MKQIYFVIFLFLSCTFLAQENWMTYPTKDKLDSLKIKSVKQIKITDTILKAPVVELIDSSLEKKTNYISEKGTLIENKDDKLDSINNYLSNYGNYSGYTIQIYVTQETLKIRKLRKEFMINFPKRTLFDEYIAPNIFLYAGKFQDYNSAELFKKELEKVFKNTLIVRKKFPYKKEKIE